MIRWLVGLWYGRMRRIDLEILWPTCKREAPDMDHAKAAFAVHAFNDRAWLVLGDRAIIEAIEALT
jgi:hypothetical protein